APLAPAGSPLIDRLTERAVPEVTCVSTVYVVLEPWTTVCADGLALIAKSSSTSADTVRLTVVECVAPDEYWPVMDRVNVPVAAVVVVAMVRTELPPAVTDVGLNEPAAPVPSPLTERVTVCAVPDATCVLTVYVVLEPWTTLCAEGLALIAKSSITGAVTVKLTVVECVAADGHWSATQDSTRSRSGIPSRLRRCPVPSRTGARSARAAPRPPC